MKKFIIFRLVLWLIILLAPLFVCAESISYTAIYNQVPQIGTDTLGGVTYSTVHYGGLYNFREPGMPSLPVEYIHFSVPYNATNFSVTSAGYNNYLQYTSNLVYPSQDTGIDDWGTTSSITFPDSNYYFTGQYFPSSRASIIDKGYLAGENLIVTVAINPISYLHSKSQNILRRTQRIVVTLNYDIADSISNYPLIRSNLSKRQEGYEFAKSVVVNPNDVIDNAPFSDQSTSFGILYTGSIPIPSPPLQNASNNNLEYIYSNDYPTYDYMIITPDSLKSSLKRIAALKRQMGYHVGIVTVEEIINNNPDSPWYHNIYNTTAQNDSARVIREYLKYAHGIGYAKFVLLAGKDVPFKYGWFKSTPTDQYYVDLSSDWELTSRGVQPELFAGRIIARSIQQINNYTDKLFRYKLNPGNGDYSYLKRALYTNGYDVTVQGMSHTEIIKQHSDSIFSNATVMMEDRENNTPSGTDIINEINNTKYGFVSLNNHGIPMGLIVYGRGGTGYHPYYWLWAIENEHAPDSVTSHANDDTMSGNGLNNLTNKYYPSICFSTGCETMPFDVMPKYSPDVINFGESFTTGKDYGGPAFLGNCRQNGFEAAVLESRVARSLRLEYRQLGVALAWAKTTSLTTYSNETHNLLGDPELEVWTDEPNTFDSISVLRYDDSITISGIGFDSTIVSYYGNDMYHRSDTTSNSIIVINNVSPNGTIMLYKSNCIPYIVPLSLQNTRLCQSQYVIASDVIAGNAIDSNRTSGDVIVSQGVEYEIEASGKVTLDDGFKVEKGATFAIYPSCF